jgi:hypothetical protein
MNLFFFLYLTTHNEIKLKLSAPYGLDCIYLSTKCRHLKGSRRSRAMQSRALFGSYLKIRRGNQLKGLYHKRQAGGGTRCLSLVGLGGRLRHVRDKAEMRSRHGAVGVNQATMSHYWAHDDYKQAMNDAIFDKMEAAELNKQTESIAIDDLKEVVVVRDSVDKLITKTEMRIDEMLAERMVDAPEFVSGTIPSGTCYECYGDAPLTEWHRDIDNKFYCTECWDRYTGADEEVPPMTPPPVLECDPRELSVVALQVKLRQVLGADAVLPKTRPVLIEMFREYYM